MNETGEGKNNQGDSKQTNSKSMESIRVRKKNGEKNNITRSNLLTRIVKDQEKTLVEAIILVFYFGIPTSRDEI